MSRRRPTDEGSHQGHHISHPFCISDGTFHASYSSRLITTACTVVYILKKKSPKGSNSEKCKDDLDCGLRGGVLGECRGAWNAQTSLKDLS